MIILQKHLSVHTHLSLMEYQQPHKEPQCVLHAIYLARQNQPHISVKGNVIVYHKRTDRVGDIFVAWIPNGFFMKDCILLLD